MPDADTLGHMSRTGAPHQRILKRVFERAMNLIADVFDGGIGSHDQGVVEVGVDALATFAVFSGMIWMV